MQLCYFSLWDEQWLVFTKQNSGQQDSHLNSSWTFFFVHFEWSYYKVVYIMKGTYLEIKTKKKQPTFVAIWEQQRAKGLKMF